MPKCLTWRSTLQCKATWPFFRSFIAPIYNGPLAQSFSTGSITRTESFALNVTCYMDLPFQTALCASSKPLQVDRCGLEGILMCKRPQELQGGTAACGPKASCGLLAPQPPGDVVFKSVLLSQGNSTRGPQGEEKNPLFP